jgi:ribonuclease BN (tRNA processing enzyme)
MIATVLGSAAAGGNPGSGCSGYLVQSGPTNVLVDCGSGTIAELKRRIEIRRLNAIVISHMHLDHILDLVTLRGAIRYAPVPLDERIALWLPPGGVEILDGLAAPLDLDHHSPLFFDHAFETAEYNPIDSLQIGEISLDFAPTQHPMPTWAMRIARSGSERALGYTADSGPVTNLAAFFHEVQTLIAEATLLHSETSPVERAHMTAREAGRLAQTCQAKQLVLTHFWEELGLDRLLLEAGTSYDGPIELAWPGMEIEIL